MCCTGPVFVKRGNGVFVAFILCSIAVSLGIIFFTFGQGVGAGYLFDDVISVAPLTQLRENPEYLWSFVFNDNSGPLGRPLSVLTFAAEQIFFSATPDVSRWISISLHGCNFVLIFLLCASILRACETRSYVKWGLLVAVLWALSPQKVSSVLYIVQRMTLLSGFFVIVALLAYFCARSKRSSGGATYFWILCAFAVIAAPFAKESGVLAVPLIAALEVFLLSRLSGFRDALLLRKLGETVLVSSGVIFSFLAVYVISNSDYFFEGRQFSAYERLISSPLVLFDYSKQFFLPSTQEMGLLHDDFQLANSAFSVRFFVFFFLVILCPLMYVWWRQRSREPSIAAFGFSVFLIGHALESFFLPLEIYFEHRNYLPSLGLALLAVPVGARALDLLGELSRWMLGFLASVYILIMGLLVFNLAAWWGSSGLLLEHHVMGHPRSARANSELALSRARFGHYDSSLKLVDKSYFLARTEAAARRMGPLDAALLKYACGCLAGKSEFEFSSEFSFRVGRDSIQTIAIRLFETFLKEKSCVNFQWDQFSDWLQAVALESYLNGDPLSASVLIDMAMFERSAGSLIKAYAYAAMVLEQSPNNGTALLMQAEMADRLGDGVSYADALARLRIQYNNGRLDGLNKKLYEKLILDYQG